MDLAKCKSLLKAFITSQFNYCPSIWMFHSRQLNNRINKIQEIALRLVYKDSKLTFDDLLKLGNSVTIHQQKLQILATEIFKGKNSLASEIMTEVFDIKKPLYNLRSETSHFKRNNVKSTLYGIWSVRHFGPKIWNIVPQNIRASNSLNQFKSLIKFWKPDTCPCRLCKNFIAQVGFFLSYMHRNYLSFIFKSFFYIVGVN